MFFFAGARVGPFAGGFVWQAAQKEKKKQKNNNFGSKMPIRGGFFAPFPVEGCQQCRHNRAGGCPAQGVGRVLLCCDGLNRMSLHPDLASRLTKGPFVTLAKSAAEVATATQGHRLNVTFQMGKRAFKNFKFLYV